MALQEECTKCRMYKKGTSKMRCSFYSSEVKFDDKPCPHYSEKKVPQDVNPQPQKTDEIVTESVYSGAYHQNRISAEDSPFEKFIKNNKWIIVLCIVLLWHALSSYLGFEGASAEELHNHKGKSRVFIALLFPSEYVIMWECIILSTLINFVFVLLYWDLKNLTQNYKSKFLTVYNTYYNMKKGNAFEELFMSQTILAVAVLANIVVSLFDYEWRLMDYLAFGMMFFVIIDLFTLGVRLRKLNLNSFGTWMFLYGIVWLLQLVDTVVEWTGGIFLGYSYAVVIVISIFEILTAIVFYVKTYHELVPVLENAEPDCYTDKNN